MKPDGITSARGCCTNTSFLNNQKRNISISESSSCSLSNTNSCKEQMSKLLKLLCSTELAELIDFEKFAFLSSNYLIGTKLVLLKSGSGQKDNLSGLYAKFKRVTQQDCGLIEIDGEAAYNFPIPYSLEQLSGQIYDFLQTIIEIIGEREGTAGTIATILEEFLNVFNPMDFNQEILQAIYDFILHYFTTLPRASRASLCNLDAIAFEVKKTNTSIFNRISGDKISRANYKKAKNIFKELLANPCSYNIDTMTVADNSDSCSRCILNELSGANCPHTATLTAGMLIIQDCAILGQLGNVLVCANDNEQRFYFICVDKIEFLD